MFRLLIKVMPLRSGSLSMSRRYVQAPYQGHVVTFRHLIEVTTIRSGSLSRSRCYVQAPYQGHTVTFRLLINVTPLRSGSLSRSRCYVQAPYKGHAVTFGLLIKVTLLCSGSLSRSSRYVRAPYQGHAVTFGHLIKVTPLLQTPYQGHAITSGSLSRSRCVQALIKVTPLRSGSLSRSSRYVQAPYWCVNGKSKNAVFNMVLLVMKPCGLVRGDLQGDWIGSAPSWTCLFTPNIQRVRHSETKWNSRCKNTKTRQSLNSPQLAAFLGHMTAILAPPQAL